MWKRKSLWLLPGQLWITIRTQKGMMPHPKKDVLSRLTSWQLQVTEKGVSQYVSFTEVVQGTNTYALFFVDTTIGRLGSIKLINPLQNTCYKYLHGHTDSIVRLKFSLTNPRWLFSKFCLPFFFTLRFL